MAEPAKSAGSAIEHRNNRVEKKASKTSTIKMAGTKRILGNAKDAVGINSKVAERLSGADFDGDTVMIIPTGGKVNIKSTSALKGLEGFDPKLQYGGKEKGTYKPMKNTQTEMGTISKRYNCLNSNNIPNHQV